MKGQPKFKYGDKVTFNWGTPSQPNMVKEGSIYIIDKYGTFENPNDVSYDILVENENTLYKHITETDVTELKTN